MHAIDSLVQFNVYLIEELLRCFQLLGESVLAVQRLHPLFEVQLKTIVRFGEELKFENVFTQIRCTDFSRLETRRKIMSY
jgi:hypothetical protein